MRWAVLQGYLRFYAAITQSDNPRNPHGLRHAWAYLARYVPRTAL
jgi:integrase